MELLETLERYFGKDSVTKINDNLFKANGTIVIEQFNSGTIIYRTPDYTHSFDSLENFNMFLGI